VNFNLTNGDEVIPLSQVPDLPFIPGRRRGRKLHPATVFRWAQHGVRGVKLATLQYGGTKVTTLTALTDFFSRLSGLQSQCQPLATKPSSQNEIETQLDEAGL
jgi:hypothetical protein